MQTNMHKLVRMPHTTCAVALCLSAYCGNNRAAAPTTLFFRSRIQVCAKGKKYLVLRQTTRRQAATAAAAAEAAAAALSFSSVALFMFQFAECFVANCTVCHTLFESAQQRAALSLLLARSMFYVSTTKSRAVEFQLSIQFQFLSSNSAAACF